MECEVASELVTEVSVLFTDNNEIQTLNRDFRGKDKPTDVLSFSQLEGPEQAMGTSLGDIVISEEYAQQQAKKLKVQYEEEIARLLIHGLLHLIGYEHENVSKTIARKMFSRQEDLVSKYGRELF